MMRMYVLDGNPADVQNVMQENRIRVERGMITLTPLSDAGLVSKKEYDAKCEECDALAAHVSELEKEFEDLKTGMASDKKDAPSADSKEAHVSDKKEAAVADPKKTRKGK